MPNRRTPATFAAVQALGIAYVLTFTALAGANAEAEAQRYFTVAPYERVEITGTVELGLEQLPKTQLAASDQRRRLAVSGSQASLDALHIDSTDGTLYIDATQTTSVLVLRLPVERLSEVVNAGAAQITSAGLRQTELVLEGRGDGAFHLQNLEVDELIVNGAGRTEFSVSGSTRHQVVEMVGMSRYDAHGLTSETSHIEVRGACTVDVWVEDLLDVLIYGIARVRYSGDPWVSQVIMGAGKIDRLPH